MAFLPVGLVMGIARHPLRGLLAAQFLGTFNDSLWRMLVALLAFSTLERELAGASETARQAGLQSATTEGMIAFMVPFHHHEWLAPLNEGVTTILLRAMKGQPDGQGAYLVPTALRYSHDVSVEETFSSRLATLEDRITWKPRPDMDVVDRIYRLGSGLLATKEVEFLGEAQSGDLVERIRGLQRALVELVERKHFDDVREGSVPERVKALRNVIRRELTDDEEDAPERVEALYDDLDTLFLAVQFYSYPGQYLSQDPTRHRIAETIMKLEEDVLRRATYPTARRAQVRFGEPVEARAFLADGGFTMKSGITPMTEMLATRIQAMLEEMTSAGGE